MKVEELRIGNYVNRDSSDYPQRIDGIKSYRVWITCLGSSVDLSDSPENIKPIPLTEEWLLKFGFKRLGKDTFYLGSIKIHHRKRGFVIAKRYVDILYVHQLQNLYFTLTGKELTIKE